jgi:hypothetical protein
MGDRRGEYSGLVERPEGKNHLGDLGVDGKNNIKMDDKK